LSILHKHVEVLSFLELVILSADSVFTLSTGRLLERHKLACVLAIRAAALLLWRSALSLFVDLLFSFFSFFFGVIRPMRAKKDNDIFVHSACDDTTVQLAQLDHFSWINDFWCFRP